MFVRFSLKGDKGVRQRLLESDRLSLDAVWSHHQFLLRSGLNYYTVGMSKILKRCVTLCNKLNTRLKRLLKVSLK